jgi:1-acyl-sn-glycerol-3-phosphate acyltransferase
LNSFFYQLLRTIFYIFFKVFNRFEVIGHENIPEKGGVIVAANHVSYLDPPVIGVALKRQATFIAKEGLFRIPLIGRGIKAFSFPVKRDRPQPSTIKEAVYRLKQGGVLVLFPEGGRSADGSFLDAKRGVGMIAATSSTPVVPALIEGTDRAFPVGAKFFRPAKIRVLFGTPIKIGGKETNKHFQERITKEVMERIVNLKSKELRAKSQGHENSKELRAKGKKQKV